METPVCFGTRCLSWRAARQIVQERGGWQAALPVAAGSANGSLRCALRGTQTPLEGSVDAKGCVPIGTGWGGYTNVCACSDLAEFNARQPRGEFGGSVLVLTNATERVHALDKATLAFRDPFEGTNRSLPRPAKNVLIRKGWVPVLTRAVYAWFKPPVISPLPCSSSRGSDAVVLRSFFTDAHGRVLQSPGAVFLEAGAYDGLIESNTWFFERCLGWRGILVEGQPSLSEQLLVNRPATLNVREASCSKRGLVKYSARPLGHRAGGASIGGISTHQGIVDERDSSGVAVQCAPLGSRLAALDVRRIDLLVLDVEGQELAVLRTIDFAWTAIGVLVVEVRGDGSRASIMRLLLRTGKFAYVGQIHGPCRRSKVICKLKTVAYTSCSLEAKEPENAPLPRRVCMRARRACGTDSRLFGLPSRHRPAHGRSSIGSRLHQLGIDGRLVARPIHHQHEHFLRAHDQSAPLAALSLGDLLREAGIA